MTDVIAQFRAAMLANGITPPDHLIGDGKHHRFNHNEAKRKQSGFYTLYLDGIPAGNFGCWRTLPDGMNWCSKTRNEMTVAEWQAHHARVTAMKVQREAEEKARHAKARKECERLWADSSHEPCPDNHPYVTAKGIIPYVATVDIEGVHNNIIVPVYIDGEIWSVQTINVGWKGFHTGGKMQGGYMDIPDNIDPLALPKTILICEGWATGCSLHEATGYAVRVAFNAGNLMAVARYTRSQLPNARIIFAADDDYCKTPNAGITSATAAAKAVGGILAVPQFGDGRGEKDTDFNDLHQKEGIETVLHQIDSAMDSVAIDAPPAGDVAESSIESGTPAPQNWQDALKKHVEKLNRNHAQVLIGGKHRILVERMDDGVAVTEFYPEIDYRKMHRHEKIQAGIRDGNAVYKNPIDAWATHADCRRYKCVVFKPSVTKQGDTGDTYNTWKGFTVEPKRGNCDKVIHHIERMACKGDSKLSEYLLNWIAYTLQYPDKPAGTAIVLRGEKGTGKGLLGTFLMGLWGGHGMHISNPKHLTGNFNAHLANTCFLFADEAFFSGDKSSEGTLKALITEKFLTVERKGIDAIQQKNYLKVFMATNSKWAVPASSDERRYFVSDMETRQDRAYYVKLSAAMEDKTVQSAFLYAMLNRDITGFHTGDIPESDALKDQRLHSLDSAGKWMVDSISAGGFEVKGDRGEVCIEKWKEEIKAKTLFDSFIFWCDAQRVGEYGRLTQQGFGRRLNKWGFSGRKSDGNIVRHIMTLDKAKEAVESVESITIA